MDRTTARRNMIRGIKKIRKGLALILSVVEPERASEPPEPLRRVPPTDTN